MSYNKLPMSYRLFGKLPDPIKTDQRRLVELLASRDAYETLLIERKIAVRSAESKVAEATEGLAAIQQHIYKLTDRIAAAEITKEETRWKGSPPAPPPPPRDGPISGKVLQGYQPINSGPPGFKPAPPPAEL